MDTQTDVQDPKFEELKYQELEEEDKINILNIPYSTSVRPLKEKVRYDDEPTEADLTDVDW